MFFIMGINDRQEELDYHQTMICDICGEYGRYAVFMTYTVLTLFFLPTFRWNRRYYVRTSCCGSIYELDPEVGEAIARGIDVEITSADLRLVQSGRPQRGYKRCPVCGYETEEDFDFCPKCGNRL